MSTPSQRERDQVNPDPARYARDRHTTLPFAALQTMLERIAATGGDREEYRKYLPSKQHHVELLPGGVIKPV